MTATVENIFHGMYVVWVAKYMSRLLGEEEFCCIRLMVKTCLEIKNIQSDKSANACANKEYFIPKLILYCMFEQIFLQMFF